ncbi:hypothetical protein CEP54_015984 [Fusarium duplospermum]|uniref:Uncharacterized protein n=1 Tax=Fusarium duplospermum TaxID=1325734 RepID=A0A428NJA9_9HYPO|nr:hypothetical protein CEP54_015984 [Fusarium duplospermum]
MVKIGLNPSVLTLNMIPIRMKYDPDWNGTFSNWPMIEQACVIFASDMLKESRIIVIGEAQFSDTCSILQSQSFSLQHLQIRYSGAAPSKRCWTLGMDFHLSEDEAFEDQELDELFNGLETTPGFTIANDVLVKDEDLVALFEQLEDEPLHSPKLPALDIHSTSTWTLSTFDLLASYPNANTSEIEEEEDIILDDEPVSHYVQLTANTLGITTSETTYAGLLLSRTPACSLKQKLLDFLSQLAPPTDTSPVTIGAFHGVQDREDWEPKSRHRRIKKRRRYERLAATSQFHDTLRASDSRMPLLGQHSR